MTSPVSPSETIAKAMEGVTPGPWDVWEEQTPTKAEAVAEMAYQVENSEPFAEAVYLLNANGKCPATTGCGPTSAANAAYIAACNPVAMREVLDELYALRETALQLEAMQREMADIRKSVRNAMGAIESNQVADKDVHGTLSRVINRLDALSGARTIIQGEKNAE